MSEMKRTYKYTDCTQVPRKEIMQARANSIEEADSKFKKKFGKLPSEVPGITVTMTMKADYDRNKSKNK